MFFISRDKGRTIFLPQPEYKVIQTVDGAITIKNPIKKIVFKSITHGGYQSSALPLKGGRKELEGYFDSEIEKTRPGVEQEEAEEFLMNHKDYGVDFVAIGEDGKALTPLEWDSPAHRSEPFLSPSGEGQYCTLCDKQVDIRGLHKHLEGKAHLALLVQAEKQQVGKARMGARA